MLADDVTTGVINKTKVTPVKELVDALERKYGSLRKAAEALGTSHQNLANWRIGKNGDFLDLLEKTRKALGVSKREMWALIRGEK